MNKENDFWIIEMHVTNQMTNEIKEKLKYVLNKNLIIDWNIIFGSLLIDMHQYDKAESYFNSLF